jgi:hypothetical protein
MRRLGVPNVNVAMHMIDTNRNTNGVKVDNVQ